MDLVIDKAKMRPPGRPLLLDLRPGLSVPGPRLAAEVLVLISAAEQDDVRAGALRLLELCI